VGRCGKIISYHKTPLRDGFIATTHEYEAVHDVMWKQTAVWKQSAKEPLRSYIKH